MTSRRAALPRICFCFIATVAGGCALFAPPEERDSGPAEVLDVSHIPEPTPRDELRTAAGNTSPYRIGGKTYHVLTDPRGYRARGVASWYGNKFHGRPTSNGELYDMYGMTAAHKTLPIPSYVRVTNLDNGKSVILRVNDRGPFHDDRLIDLTYTAARKLGFAVRGITEVEVEYIDPATYVKAPSTADEQAPPSGRRPAPSPANPAGYALPANTFLQLGAFRSESSAQDLRARVADMTGHAVAVVPPVPGAGTPLYRVQVGPFGDNLEILQLRKRLLEERLPLPHVVYR